MANLLSWGKKAVAQVNPFDNGRTWQNQAPTSNRSVVGQLTHNGITNNVGSFSKPFAEAGKGFVQGTGQVLGTPVEDARFLAAKISNNLAAQNAARQRLSNDLSQAAGFAQFLPRAGAQVGLSAYQGLRPGAFNPNAGSFTPTGAAKVLFGAQPVQSFSNVGNQVLQEGGGQAKAQGTVALNALMDALALKGGIKSAQKAEGVVKTTVAPIVEGAIKQRVPLASNQSGSINFFSRPSNNAATKASGLKKDQIIKEGEINMLRDWAEHQRNNLSRPNSDINALAANVRVLADKTGLDKNLIVNGTHADITKALDNYEARRNVFIKTKEAVGQGGYLGLGELPKGLTKNDVKSAKVFGSSIVKGSKPKDLDVAITVPKNSKVLPKGSAGVEPGLIKKGNVQYSVFADTPTGRLARDQFINNTREGTSRPAISLPKFMKLNEVGGAKAGNIPGLNKLLMPDSTKPIKNPALADYYNAKIAELKSMDGHNVVLNKSTGKRVSDNSPVYSELYAKNGKPPTKQDYIDYIHQQNMAGKPVGFASPDELAQYKQLLKNPKPTTKPNSPALPKTSPKNTLPSVRGGVKPSREVVQKANTPNLNKDAFTPKDIAKLEKMNRADRAKAQIPETMGKAQAPQIKQAAGSPIPPSEIPKSIPNKPDFIKATNDFLGAKKAGQTTNVAAIRQLPKLDSKKSFGLIDAIQQGADSGTFKGAPKEIRGILDAKYAELKKAGVDVGYLRDYFPQQWKNATPEQVTDAFLRLNQKAGFQNPRTIPTVQEGISLGFVPKHTDYRQALTEYLDSADKLIANKKYFDDLKQQGLIVESARRPNGMQVIDAPGVPQARSLMDKELGVEVQQNHYATPEVAKDLNRLFSPDIRGKAGNVAKATGNTSGFMQTVFLSGGVPGTPLNAFGAAQWTKQALSGRPISATKSFLRSFSEKKTADFETKNLPYIQKMQKAGVPFNGPLDAKALTSVGERVAQEHGIGKAKTAIVEGWNKAVEDPTFRRYMSSIQLDTFKSAYERGIKNKLSDAQATELAAKTTSNAFGLNSLAKDALKSPVGRDVTRTIFFAPKFRESMVNFWGKNAKALGNPTNPAYRENVKFLANATILFGAMEAANMALNEGKTTFQNENPNDRLSLSIPKGNGKSLSVPFLSSIATVPRVGVNAAIDLKNANFKEAGLEGKKLLSQLIRPPLDVAFNQKYNGRDIYKEKDSAGQKFKDVGAYVAGQYNHPYIAAGINKATGKSSGPLEDVVTATELPVRFRNYDNTTEKSKSIAASKDYDNFKSKVPSQGSSLTQLSDGSYAYSIDGKPHQSKDLSTARNAIAGEALKKSGESYRVVGQTVYRKGLDGKVSPTPKIKFDNQVNSATLTAQKNGGDINGWFNTATNQLQNIQKQLQDPSIDPLEQLTLQNQANTLLNNMSKYKSYGGFTKAKAAKKLSSNSFKITAPKIKAPKGVKVKVSSAKFKAPKTKKIAVSKLPKIKVG